MYSPFSRTDKTMNFSSVLRAGRANWELAYLHRFANGLTIVPKSNRPSKVKVRFSVNGTTDFFSSTANKFSRNCLLMVRNKLEGYLQPYLTIYWSKINKQLFPAIHDYLLIAGYFQPFLTINWSETNKQAISGHT